MQIVVAAMGKRFVIDDGVLYGFLKSNGQCLDVPQQVREVTNQNHSTDQNNYDERVLIKG